jgi:hydrogenase-4 component F
MPELALLLLLPLVGAATFAFLGASARAPEANAAFSGATALAAVVLAIRVLAEGPQLAMRDLFHVDAFNVFLVALTALVGFTTSLFSRPYMRNELVAGRVGPTALRLYHAMYQLFVGTMLLALTTNNIGILWVAMETATVTTVLLVSLYRTPASVRAAWKYFILCGVGIAQALFGTILLYLAAERVLGGGGTALLWTQLEGVKDQLEPSVVTIAFVFLLVGYGTKAGLVPLHNWLPDAHAEGPTPITAVLSGLLLNVALYAIARSKVLADGALGTPLAGNLMMGFGLLTVVVAAFMTLRQTDVKRLFGYSSVKHMGLITFAFGMGGAAATFAGLLHMTVHSLTKSAIFFAVGHATQKAGTQVIDEIRGLVHTSPAVGWGLMLGGISILGMPPFGVFAAEFLLLTTAMSVQPWAALVLLVALAVSFGGILWRVQSMVFGAPNLKPLLHRPAILPVFVHLGLTLLLGFYLPPFLAAWYREAARLIG